MHDEAPRADADGPGSVRATVGAPHPTTRRDATLLALLVLNAVTAAGGGLALMTGLIREQPAWLRHTDFGSAYLPGVVLLAVVGGSAAIAALAMAKRLPGWELASVVSGVVIVVWIVGEVASIRGFHVLQLVYVVTGVLVVWLTPSRGGASTS